MYRRSILREREGFQYIPNKEGVFAKRFGPESREPSEHTWYSVRLYTRSTLTIRRTMSRKTSAGITIAPTSARTQRSFYYLRYGRLTVVAQRKGGEAALSLLITYGTRSTPTDAIPSPPLSQAKTRRAPSRHSRDARVYGDTTMAMHDNEYPPPRPWYSRHTYQVKKRS